MKPSYIVWGILGVAVLFALWVWSGYNGLVSSKGNVDAQWAQVETQYQRRFDLVPNLVSTVKGAANFEQSTLTAVTAARTQWMQAPSRNEKVDAAVTLNTGYLVYKECVLRGIVDRERESALAALIKQLIITLQTGRGGNPTFWQSKKENLDRSDQRFLTSIQQRSAALNPAFQSKLVRSEARDYMTNTRQPDAAYDCPYKGENKKNKKSLGKAY
jgi:hypothetical protein